MEKARCNTELYSNLRGPLNNVKPSNFWGSHQRSTHFVYSIEIQRVIERKSKDSQNEDQGDCDWTDVADEEPEDAEDLYIGSE